MINEGKNIETVNPFRGKGMLLLVVMTLVPIACLVATYTLITIGVSVYVVKALSAATLLICAAVVTIYISYDHLHSKKAS